MNRQHRLAGAPEDGVPAHIPQQEVHRLVAFDGHVENHRHVKYGARLAARENHRPGDRHEVHARSGGAVGGGIFHRDSAVETARAADGDHRQRASFVHLVTGRAELNAQRILVVNHDDLVRRVMSQHRVHRIGKNDPEGLRTLRLQVVRDGDREARFRHPRRESQQARLERVVRSAADRGSPGHVVIHRHRDRRRARQPDREDNHRAGFGHVTHAFSESHKNGAGLLFDPEHVLAVLAVFGTNAHRVVAVHQRAVVQQNIAAVARAVTARRDLFALRAVEFHGRVQRVAKFAGSVAGRARVNRQDVGGRRADRIAVVLHAVPEVRRLQRPAQRVRLVRVVEGLEIQIIVSGMIESREAEIVVHPIVGRQPVAVPVEQNELISYEVHAIRAECDPIAGRRVEHEHVRSADARRARHDGFVDACARLQETAGQVVGELEVVRGHALHAVVVRLGFRPDRAGHQGAKDRAAPADVLRRGERVVRLLVEVAAADHQQAVRLVPAGYAGIVRSGRRHGEAADNHGHVVAAGAPLRERRSGPVAQRQAGPALFGGCQDERHGFARGKVERVVIGQSFGVRRYPDIVHVPALIPVQVVVKCLERESQSHVAAPERAEISGHIRPRAARARGQARIGAGQAFREAAAVIHIDAVIIPRAAALGFGQHVETQRQVVGVRQADRRGEDRAAVCGTRLVAATTRGALALPVVNTLTWRMPAVVAAARRHMPQPVAGTVRVVHREAVQPVLEVLLIQDLQVPALGVSKHRRAQHAAGGDEPRVQILRDGDRVVGRQAEFLLFLRRVEDDPHRVHARARARGGNRRRVHARHGNRRGLQDRVNPRGRGGRRADLGAGRIEQTDHRLELRRGIEKDRRRLSRIEHDREPVFVRRGREIRGERLVVDQAAEWHLRRERSCVREHVRIGHERYDKNPALHPVAGQVRRDRPRGRLAVQVEAVGILEPVVRAEQRQRVLVVRQGRVLQSQLIGVRIVRPGGRRPKAADRSAQLEIRRIQRRCLHRLVEFNGDPEIARGHGVAVLHADPRYARRIVDDQVDVLRRRALAGGGVEKDQRVAVDALGKRLGVRVEVQHKRGVLARRETAVRGRERHPRRGAARRPVQQADVRGRAEQVVRLRTDAEGPAFRAADGQPGERGQVDRILHEPAAHRRLRIAEQIAFVVAPANALAVDVPQVVLVAVGVQLSEPDQVLAETGIPELAVETLARTVGRVAPAPAVTRIEDQREHAVPRGRRQVLGHAVDLEIPRDAALGVRKDQVVVRQSVGVGVVKLHHVVVVRVAEVVDDPVGGGVDLPDQVGLLPGVGIGVVERIHVEQRVVRESGRRVPGGTASATDLLHRRPRVLRNTAEPQVLPAHQRRVEVLGRLRLPLVRQRLVYEVRHLVGVFRGRAANVHLGRQVHVAAALPVRRLAPEPVPVVIVRPVETLEVKVAGKVVDLAGRRTPELAHRHNVGVAGEQDVIRFPVVVGVDDEVADLLRVIDAGVVRVDIRRRDHRGGQPARLLVREQVRERVRPRRIHQLLAGHNDVCVAVRRIREPPRDRPAPAPARFAVARRRVGVVHRRLDRAARIRAVPHDDARTFRLQRHAHRQLADRSQLPGSRYVLHRVQGQHENRTAPSLLDADEIVELPRIRIPRVVDGGVGFRLLRPRTGNQRERLLAVFHEMRARQLRLPARNDPDRVHRVSLGKQNVCGNNGQKRLAGPACPRRVAEQDALLLPAAGPASGLRAFQAGHRVRQFKHLPFRPVHANPDRVAPARIAQGPDRPPAVLRLRADRWD